MTAINVLGMKGEIPRLAAELLPNSNAQNATNCILLNGNVVPLKGVLPIQTFPGGPFQSIFWLARQYWLRWTQVVDVARSVILGDTSGRIFFTGTDAPRVTDIALATGLVQDTLARPTSFFTEFANAFTIPATGASVGVTIGSTANYAIGNVVNINDFNSTVTGYVTHIAGSVLTVVLTAVDNVGALMATGAQVSILGSFAIQPVGQSQVVYVNNAAQFTIGQTTTITDTTSTITGTIIGINVGSGGLTVQTLSISAGALTLMNAPATVTVANPGTNYPYLSLKLGVPEPLNPVSVDYDISQFVVVNLDPCSTLSTASASNVTSAPFTIAAVGSTQSVTVVPSGTPFAVGETVNITDGVNNINGLLTAINVNTGTVQTIAILAGTAGATMATDATVTVSSYTPDNDGNGTVNIDTSFGNPLPSFLFTPAQNNFLPVWLYRDMGFDQPVTILQFDFHFKVGSTGPQQIEVVCGASANGAGPSLIFAVAGGISEAQSAQWGQTSGQVVQLTTAFNPGVNFWYRTQIVYEGASEAGFVYQVIVRNGITLAVLFNQKFTLQNGPQGPIVGWKYTAGLNILMSLDNIGVQNLIPSGADKAADYVWTFVNSMGFESAPSPVSNVIVTADTLRKIITFPTEPQGNEQMEYGSAFLTDYGIIGRRLYRAVSSAAGSSFLRVADETLLPLSETTYIDYFADSQLGAALPTDGYELPPADGHSMLSLPNGLTAIASGNQTCVSPPDVPYAFPLNQRYPTDTDVVKLNNIDATIVITTLGFPYLCSGSDPTSMNMDQLERSYGNVAALGTTYLRQFGVIYPSATGLIAIPGAALRNLTEAFFTMEEGAGNWLDLNPASFVCSVRDDRYIGFCTVGQQVKGFVFDPKEQGQAWSWFDLSPDLNFDQVPAGGYFTDDVTGDLYLIQGSNLGKWDAADSLTMIWHSKLFRQPRRTCMSMARVKMLRGYDPNTTPVTMTYTATDAFGNTNVAPPRTVVNQLPFTILPLPGDDLEFEMRGSWAIQQVEFGEKLEDFT